MNKPLAIRLADALDQLYKTPPSVSEAAAELRRLHEANKELVEALHHISLCSQNSMSSKTECGTIARAAIAKATGEQA